MLGKSPFYFSLSIILRLPFDWKTRLGYVIALTYVIIAAACCQIFFSLILCFHVGFCWLIISFVKDITNDLNASTHRYGQSDERIAQTFYGTVDFYSNLRQLRDE